LPCPFSRKSGRLRSATPAAAHTGQKRSPLKKPSLLGNARRPPCWLSTCRGHINAGLDYQHGLIGENRTEIPLAGQHTASTIAHPQRHAVGRQPPGFAPSLHCGGTRGVARKPDAAMQRALIGLQCTREQIHGAGQVAACPAPICWSLRESGGASRQRGPGARPRRQPGSPLTMRKSSLFRGRSSETGRGGLHLQSLQHTVALSYSKPLPQKPADCVNGPEKPQS